MLRIVKSTIIMFLSILVFSLVGCNSTANTSSSKKTIEEVQTTKQTTSAEPAQTSTTKTNPTHQAPSSSKQQKSTSTSDRPLTSSKQSPAVPVTKESAPVNTADDQGNAAAKSTSAKASATTVSAAAKQTPVTKASPEPAAVSQPTKAVTNVPVQTVKLTIVGPNDQPKINRTLTVNIKDGDTVLDVLLHGIGQNNVDYSGSGATAYVSGIENVYQFDYGPKSGWTVSQNGIKLAKSAGIIKVKAGDDLAWVYTKDYTVNN